jgi:hypothetical protein
MWPWGHAAVGYLLYTSYCRARGRRPRGLPVVALAVGTQFPDLIDKPFAWTFAVLPSGRSLGHSVLFLALVVVVLWYLTSVEHDPLVGAFAIGSFAHLFGDALYPAIAGDFVYTRFLVWPLLPVIKYETGQSFLAHLTAIELTPTFGFELLLVVLATAVWYADGMPGLGRLRSRPSETASVNRK